MSEESVELFLIWVFSLASFHYILVLRQSLVTLKSRVIVWLSLQCLWWKAYWNRSGFQSGTWYCLPIEDDQTTNFGNFLPWTAKYDLRKPLNQGTHKSWMVYKCISSSQAPIWKCTILLGKYSFCCNYARASDIYPQLCRIHVLCLQIR